MSNPSIVIDPNEACEIERNITLCKIYYQPSGYHSNARLLHGDLKKKGYNFTYKKVRDWLHNQSSWQIYAPPPKDISRVSYSKIS